MSTIKQLGLLPAGCQPWNINVCAASGDRFAYCATLAVYIYQYDHNFREFKLHSIMSEHKKTITGIRWCPHDPDLLISASAEHDVLVWNVPQEKAVGHLRKLRDTVQCIDWMTQDRNCVTFISGRGPLHLWNFRNSVDTAAGLTSHKEIASFQSDVTQIRWHPKESGKLCLGHVNGTLSIFSSGKRGQKHVLSPIEDDEEAEENDSVVSLEWDPLSTEYLLVANTHTGIRLVDTSALSVVQRFQLPSAATQVHTLDWVDSAPGMFVTGDLHSGVMRVWSVAKTTPLENLKVKKTGFHCLKVFTTVSKTEETGSGPAHHGYNIPTMSPAGRFALPPAFVVCTFMDGGVGLYSMPKRQWCFLRDEGHIETIFDCRFKPDNPDLLATASFDGTIKIWNINSMTCVSSSPGNEGVIYALSWAPSDLDCVAACTSKNGAFIWDLKKSKVIKRFQEHGTHSVYSVAWNEKDSRRIATCGGDGKCIVRQVDGTVLATFVHPAPVFGCDWNPNNKDIIATGCEDCCVRVFYLPTAQNDKAAPLKVFQGHQAKVFHVRWSPLKDGILCSGSDDCTIRVWDYSKENCIMTLHGHTGPVRGLLWNMELPYLLTSGSWDCTMRIWDVRDGTCLETMLDHGADVYGLTSHPERPFVFASSSRDSTLRVWSLNSLIQPLELNILAKRPVEELYSSPETSMLLGTAPLLCGRASREMRMQLENVTGETRCIVLRLFSRFFSSPTGSNNLWELVSVVKGLDASLLSEDYSKGIMHMSHITKFKAGEAQELQMAKRYSSGIGAPKREDKLREAAQIHLKLGNLQQYCEVLVELGQWEKALSVAPGVSLHYWKTLSQRHIKLLGQDESEDLVPHAVAIGDMETLVSLFTTQGKLQDAMMVATAGYEGNITAPVTGNRKSATNGVDSSEQDSMNFLRQASDGLADWYFRNGSPIQAASCHMVVNDTEKAISKLVRGNELELAVSVGTVLKVTSGQVEEAVGYLARRCERIGKWELAVDLLKTAPPCEKQLSRLCARCAASMAEINDLHLKADFPSMEECLTLAGTTSDLYSSLMYYMMSAQPEKGLEAGLKAVKGVMSRPEWTVQSVWDFLQMMGAIRTEYLQQYRCSRYRGELLVLSAYVGALVAVRRDYTPVVEPLFEHVLCLLRRETDIRVPISESLVVSELEAWKAHQKHNRSAGSSQVNNSQQTEVYSGLLAKAGKEPSPVGLGRDCVSGSQLPCHSDVHESVFTKHRIQGPAFFLEDGRSAISISDALMWAKVTPFSPLGSGVRINPF